MRRFLCIAAAAVAIGAPSAMAQRGPPTVAPATVANWRTRPPIECLQPPQPPVRGLWNANLWPGGVVPYQFDGTTPIDQRLVMRAAMDELEHVAAVRFVARAGQSDYLHITPSTGNGSYVGRQGGSQVVNIFNWNIRFIMAHELMHALGIWHEHSRPDRADYIAVNAASIQPAYAYNFAISPTGAPTGPYDFDSVMHYGPCAFSACCPYGTTCACDAGCESIDALPAFAQFQGTMGQRTHLSQGDIDGLVARYGPPPTAGVINLDAATYCSGSGSASLTHITLAPGSYALVPIGAGGPDGGASDAWMAGADTSGCADGCCVRGWSWSYEFQVGGGAWNPVGLADCPRDTPAAAFAAQAMTTMLDLPDGGTVQLRVSSINCTENRGGVSLKVVPCGTITAQPQGSTVTAGRSIVLLVAAASQTACTYQWRRGGENLADGGPIQGASTSTLTISPAAASLAGSYDVLVTDACGPTASAAAMVDVLCPADWDRDGAVTVVDVALFVNDWFTGLDQGTLDGDFNGDGLVQPADVGEFISAWFATLVGGC